MNNVSMIGLNPQEVSWMRQLLSLLRHPDPVVGEVSREALRYLQSVAVRADETRMAS